jgi:SAM-dependent methyltransferase
MTRRRQHVPWKAAGTASEAEHSADDVVRETGWVFNNVTGSDLSLAEFVETGDHETVAYLQAFGLLAPDMAEQTIVEIGSGIGRMTASFSRQFAKVIACDLDAAFLERCRETVAQFGKPSGCTPATWPTVARWPWPTTARSRVQLHHAPALPPRRRPGARP